MEDRLSALIAMYGHLILSYVSGDDIMMAFNVVLAAAFMCIYIYKNSKR